MKLQIKRAEIIDMVKKDGSDKSVAVQRDVTPPRVDFSHGEYRRRFERTDEPFIIKSQDEADMLLRSGSFEEVKEAAPVTGGPSTTTPPANSNASERKDKASDKTAAEAQGDSTTN